MLDFYKDVRAEDCEQQRDGDMLLFQWGNHNWGKGFSFEFDLICQFIRSQPEEEDDDQVEDAAISQLSSRFYFAPTAELGAIESSNRWCSTPDELAAFERIHYWDRCASSG
jgi:hypothetical protein